MASRKVKLFRSRLQAPKPVPDGTSLEEQMNAFLSQLIATTVVDVQTRAVSTRTGSMMYVGWVSYTG